MKRADIHQLSISKHFFSDCNSSRRIPNSIFCQSSLIYINTKSDSYMVDPNPDIIQKSSQEFPP